jgi:hypothetical protein
LIRICLLIAIFALALPATAQATFQSLGRLSDSAQDARTPQVGVDQNGNAVYVWAHYDGTSAEFPNPATDPRACCFRIEARTRTAGGTLGAVKSISIAGKNATQPQVAVDPSGNAYITWLLNNGTNMVVQTRRLSSTGTLGVTQNLSAAGLDANEPQVAVDPNGNAVFTWERFDGTTGCGNPHGCLRIQVRRRASAGTLSATQTLSNAGQIAFSSQLGVSSAGNAVVVWTAFTGSKDDIQLRTRAAGGALGTLQTLSGTKDSTQSQIGVRPSNGDAVVTWIEGGSSDVVVGRARSSTGTLSAIQTLSTGQFSEEPQVAVDSNGNAIFIWERYDATQPGATPPCCFRVETRTRTAAGTLGTTEIHSAAGRSAFAPQVGFDSTGNAVLAWGRNDGTSSNCCSLIQTRRRTSSGTLSAVQTLSVTGRNATEPQMAVDPAGNAVYAWTRSDGTYNRIQGRRRASTGTLSTLQTLSSVGPAAFTPQVAVDPNGNAVFTWMAFNGVTNSIQARARSSAGVLGFAQGLSDATQNASQPQVGIDSTGNAVFVWKRFDATSGTCCDRIQAVTRSSAGVLGTVETLSDPGQNADAPQVAVDPNGNAVFTWVLPDGTNTRVQGLARSSTGTLSPVQTLSAAGQNASEPQVGIDSTGNAVFTWKRSDGTNTRIEAIARSAAGTLSAVQLLSLAGQNASQPQVSVFSNGNAAFTWMRFDGTNNRTETRTRSAAGTLTPVQPLSAPGQNASQPQVAAVSSSGAAVYAWTRFDGTDFRVQTRARSSAGVLSAVQIVSPAGASSGIPQLAVDSSGNAVIVWRFDGANKRVEARTRSAAGTLGAVQFLSIAGFDADLPQIAVSPGGTALVPWQLFDGKKSRVEGSVGP